MKNQPICTFKERLKEALEIRNMKQVELSEKTNIAKGSINHYLSGYSEPKTEKLYLIAKALDVSETWLMGYDVPMSRKKSITEAFNLDQAGLLAEMRRKPKVQEAVIELLKLNDEDIEFYTENLKRVNRGKK